MNNDLNISVLRKLKPVYPESADWIIDRAELIAERGAFNRGVNVALAPLTLTFWKQAFEGASRIMIASSSIFSQKNHYTKPKNDTVSESWKAVGNDLDKSYDNLRLAMAEYITEKQVPLDIFTADEQIHLFGQTAPSFADDYKPHNSL